MSNTVYPVAAYEGQMTAIVIPMNSNFSVGILNEDSTEAFFPLGFDETDRETALSSARRYSEGFFGPRTDVVSREGYTMPYPIKKRNETVFSHTEGKTIVLIDPGNLDTGAHFPDRYPSPRLTATSRYSHEEICNALDRWADVERKFNEAINAVDYAALPQDILDKLTWLEPVSCPMDGTWHRAGNAERYPVKKWNKLISQHEKLTARLRALVEAQKRIAEAAQMGLPPDDAWEQTVQNAADFNAASLKSLDRFLEKEDKPDDPGYFIL